MNTTDANAEFKDTFEQENYGAMGRKHLSNRQTERKDLPDEVGLLDEQAVPKTYSRFDEQTVMDMIMEGGIESDKDSIDEDALRDVECWSESDDDDNDRRNTLIQDINRLMLVPSGYDDMFDDNKARTGHHSVRADEMANDKRQRCRSYASALRSQGAMPQRFSRAITSQKSRVLSRTELKLLEQKD